MIDAVGALAGVFVIIVILVLLLTSKAWGIRIWDFPRVQLAVVGGAPLSGIWFAPLSAVSWIHYAFLATLGLAVAFQIALVWRYSPLAPKEVQASRHPADVGSRVSLAMSNVL